MLVNDPKKALTATVMSLFVGLCGILQLSAEVYI
jgi:hypothetical protein